MARPNTPKPSRIHHLLGSIAFVAFLILVVLDALPRYEVSIYLAGMIVVSYLVLLGFGAIITRVIEAKYE